MNLKLESLRKGITFQPDRTASLQEANSWSSKFYGPLFKSYSNISGTSMLNPFTPVIRPFHPPPSRQHWISHFVSSLPHWPDFHHNSGPKSFWRAATQVVVLYPSSSALNNPFVYLSQRPLFFRSLRQWEHEKSWRRWSMRYTVVQTGNCQIG